MPNRYAIFAVLPVLLSAGCGLKPIKPAPTHISAPAEPAVTGTVPPVQLAPALPKPTPSQRPETYSVVVNNVRVQELLFALARDAKINIDIAPDISGSVTLNAIDQTLAQLLERVARQSDIRYEMVGKNLVVMRDTPYLRAYRVDYVSAERRVEMRSDLSTQFAASAAPGAGGGATTGTTSSGTGSTAKVEIKSSNRLWDTVVENVKGILQETDKVLPAGQVVATAQQASAPGAQAQSAGGAAGSPQQANVTFREAASVIANREGGILYVRATAKQHEKVQEFLDQVMASVKRQVLIEVTVTEVGLTDEFQRGIDWNALRTTSGGTVSASQTAVFAPPGTDLGSFAAGYVRTSGNFVAAIKFLESFGTVRVLSSPKLSVLNNQTALLRVTRDLIYFTLTPVQVTVGATGGGTVNVPATFTTTPNVAAEGFMMGVLPQVGEGDVVVLNVRPTIRRKVAEQDDPNPELAKADPPIKNAIPVFETREFESILRIPSGEIAVLGGLMQDVTENVEGGVPLISDIPFVGWLFKQTRQVTKKTELVIFIRPTVIKDASIAGDYSRFRDHLPTEQYFARPDPAREAPKQPAPAR